MCFNLVWLGIVRRDDFIVGKKACHLGVDLFLVANCTRFKSNKLVCLPIDGYMETPVSTVALKMNSDRVAVG